jgi:Protein of unknown function DUF2834
VFRFYVAACIVGSVVPLAALGVFLAHHGVDLPELWRMLTANPISVFAWLDVAISAVVVIVTAVAAGRRGLRGWGWAVAGTCLVGVSLGLPLLLALRERQRAAGAVAG